MVLGGEAARREHHAGETDQRQPHRCSRQLVEQVPGNVRPAQLRQAGGHRADDGHPTLIEIEDSNHGCGDQQRQQSGWQARQQARRDQQHGEGAQPDQQGRPVVVGILLDQLQRSRHNAGRIDGYPGQLAHLPGENVQGHPVEETDQDGLGEKVGQRPEVDEARQDAEHPGQPGEGNRQREIEFAIAGGERDQRRSHQRAGCGVRPDDQLARGAEQGIDQQRQYAGIQADHRAEAGELGIGDTDRQGDGGHRHASDQVVRQIVALIGEQRREAWSQALHPAGETTVLRFAHAGDPLPAARSQRLRSGRVLARPSLMALPTAANAGNCRAVGTTRPPVSLQRSEGEGSSPDRSAFAIEHGAHGAPYGCAPSG
ncbi:hypothetical protein D3C80_1170160 [compost metagenome]